MIRINARVARTLTDAKPLVYGGQHVYVSFGEDAAYLHLGGSVVAERPVAEVASIITAQDWAYETIEAADTLVADMDAVSDAVYCGTAHQVRTQGAEILAEADKKDAEAQQVASRPSKADPKNPRHPLNRAARIRYAADHLRKEAAVLASWTALDEMHYTDYVQKGLGDTNGPFAPEGRAAWKAHNS